MPEIEVLDLFFFGTQHITFYHRYMAKYMNICI